MRKIAIIGAGKVGVAFGVLFERHGWPVVGCAYRSPSSSGSASGMLNCPVTTDLTQAVAGAQVIMLTVQDREIANACLELVRLGLVTPGAIVVHTSGSLDLSGLQPAADAKASIGSMHPIQTFPTIESAIRHLPGSWFGVTARGAALEAITDIVEVLGGHIVEIDEQSRVLYHLAAVAACNFTVGCLDLAVRLNELAGVGPDLAYDILKPLIYATLDNIADVGPAGALTGPVDRGDLATVGRHMAALREYDLEDLEFYKAVSRQLAAVALRKGSLSPEDKKELDELIGKE